MKKVFDIIEPKLFYFVLGVLSLPVLLLSPFPTIDGPVHLYNSNLINELLRGNSLVAAFFEFNNSPEPNWLSHIILSVGNFLLPALWTEKLILLLILISVPIAFRRLLFTVNRSAIVVSWLCLPFLYGYFFYMGFYNFSLSLTILFILLRKWLLKQQGEVIKGYLIRFIFWVAMLYFSHLITFMFFMLIYLIWFIYSLSKGRNVFYKVRTELLVLVIPLMLLLWFILSNSANSNYAFLNKNVVLTWLAECSPIIALNHNKEMWFGIGTAVVSLLLLIATFLKKGNERNSVIPWSWISFMLFVSLLFAPNEMSSGGYIVNRLILFFYFSIFILIASKGLSVNWSYSIIMITTVLSLAKTKMNFNDSKLLSEDAMILYKASAFIEKESVLLPLNYSDNWMHSNFSTYIGAEKDILVLDNYEASKPHFPLRWKMNMEPYEVLGNYANSNRPCITLSNFEKASNAQVDYITRWYYKESMQDSCTVLVNGLLNSKYNRVYVSDNSKLEVFKRKY